MGGNNRIGIKVGWMGVNLIHQAHYTYVQGAGSCERWQKPLGSIKCGNIWSRRELNLFSI